MFSPRPIKVYELQCPCVVPLGNQASRGPRVYCQNWLTRRQFNFCKVCPIYLALKNKIGFYGSVLVDQPTLHSGGVNRGMLCGDRWHLFALNLLFMFLQFFLYLKKNLFIGTFRTHQEIQCLPYAGFLERLFLNDCFSFKRVTRNTRQGRPRW